MIPNPLIALAVVAAGFLLLCVLIAFVGHLVDERDRAAREDEQALRSAERLDEAEEAALPWRADPALHNWIQKG